MSLKNDSKVDSLDDVINLLINLNDKKNIELEIPDVLFAKHQDKNQTIEYGRSISLKKYNWENHLNQAYLNSINISPLLSFRPKPTIEITKWKIPLILGITLLTFNTISLNWSWWNMENKAYELNEAITKIFITKFPDDKVILDPLAQMRQKMDYLSNSNPSNINSFMSLVIALGEFRETLLSRRPDDPNPGVVSIEYRNRSLYVHFDPKQESILEKNRSILDELGLSVREMSSKDKGIIWEISEEEP